MDSNSSLSILHDQVFEKFSDALLIIEDKMFIDCNEAAVKMLECESKEHIFNTSPAEFSPKFQPDGQLSKDKAIEKMKRAMEIGAQRFEWLHKTKNDNEFHVEVLLTHLPFQGRDLLHVSWRDISNRKLSEEKIQNYQNQLIELNKQLEQTVERRTNALNHSNEELMETIDDLKLTQKRLISMDNQVSLSEITNDILTDISKPIKTALRILKDLTNQIDPQEDNSSGEPTDSFEAMQQEALANTIENIEHSQTLLDGFIQLNQSYADFSVHSFNLFKLIQDLHSALKTTCINNGIEFEFECDKDIAMTSYPGLIAKVLVNLVFNSIQHAFKSTEEDKIQIKVKQSTESLANLTILVRDNGRGISKAIRDQIYDPFFTTNMGSTNLGTGLTIVRASIEKIGGKISLNEESKIGTEFILTIPRVAP